MSRRPQTCADCARRKIKCNKVIPCDNCQKRGCANLCRRADVSHSAEKRGTSTEAVASLPAPAHTTASAQQQPINERILSLVTTLAERVEHLEAKLDGEPSRKRSMIDPRLENPSREATTFSLHQDFERPAKHAKRNRGHLHNSAINSQSLDMNLEEESSSGQNDSETEVEDAATVLEFLAWGRVKDSSLTNGIREVPPGHDPTISAERDVIQAAQAWGSSPSSFTGGAISIETPQIFQMQDLLPSKSQMYSLFDYHATWLLFMHCSFHAPTVRQELEEFYDRDNGNIQPTSSGLQWIALLFSIICGSITCGKPAQVLKWGYCEDDQSILSKKWYQAFLDCLNAARYQQYHNVYGVQAITTSTIAAHILGFSNTQSVLLASGVRIAQSIGLHRLSKPRRNSGSNDDQLVGTIKKEVGRRVWQQLATQDWFSVPFSETYCVNPLHFSTCPPRHCDEETMRPVSLTYPTMTVYGNFLFQIASLMPALQDCTSEAHTPETKYDQVLRFDKMMRDLVMSQLPSCLNSQTDIVPDWPPFVALARRCLTITSAHKIIMIHRRFLGMSFHDKRFAFTRRTCLAAAKTIINEMKKDLPEDSPILWTTQAFSVAAAIILSLDNFNRRQSSHEYEEHRGLIKDTISVLSASTGVSSIAARGTRLLSDLLAEEYMHNQHSYRNSGIDGQGGTDAIPPAKRSENSLDVAAFVKKFCEIDQTISGNSPAAACHMPLWLQQEEQYMVDLRYNPIANSTTPSYRTDKRYHPHTFHEQQMTVPSDIQGYGYLETRSRRNNPQVDTFAQQLSDSFDIRSGNWFDDLLGLAPSNSI